LENVGSIEPKNEITTFSGGVSRIASSGGDFSLRSTCEKTAEGSINIKAIIHNIFFITLSSLLSFFTRFINIRILT
jgi:hypothetical protein